MDRFGYRRDATIKVRNLLRLIEALRCQQEGVPFTVPAFARANDCSPRTVYRDLALLAQEGWVRHDDKAHSYQLTPEAGRFSAVALSAEDAVALALARTLLFASPALADSASLRLAFERVLAGLPRSFRERASRATQAVRAAPAPTASTAALQTSSSSLAPSPDVSPSGVDVLSAVLSATSERTTLQILYESLSSGEQGERRRKWRNVDPYEIEQDAIHPGKLYLHGWCHTHAKIRTFVIGRVYDVRAPFPPDVFMRREREWEAFAAEQGVVGGLRGGSPILVDVRFSPVAARYALHHRWPDGLTIAAEKNGSARLTGTALGTQGIICETLRWRRHAHVVGGPELLVALREELEAIARLYDAA